MSMINRIQQTDEIKDSFEIAEQSSMQVVSLEDRLRNACAEAAAYYGTEKQNLTLKVADPGIAGNLKELHELNGRVSKYSNDINLLSALARKGVDAISTLMKL